MVTANRQTIGRHIGARLQRLRVERELSQAELAGALGLSQPQLSAIERGRRSLTAEQFLEVLQLFNVPATDFVPTLRASGTQLQNALARLGATSLRESADIVPSELVKEVNDLIREVLTSAESPRLITALAPVIVAQVDSVNFQKLHAQLSELGLAKRLGWLLDNTLNAIEVELVAEKSRKVRVAYHRAMVQLGQWLVRIHREASRSSAVDVLDRDARSKKSLLAIADAASRLSRHWGVVTRIQVEDFAAALRASRVGD